MVKNKIFFGLLSSTLSLLLLADSTSVTDSEQVSSDGSTSMSDDKQKMDLNLNKAYLDLFYNKERIREIRAKSETIDKELEGTADLAESFKPLEKSITTVDKLFLHPKRSVTVILPEGAKITYLAPTFSAKFIEYDKENPKNLFNILPMPAFTSGDITIFYTIGDKNFILKLVCEKYLQLESSSKMYYGVVVYKDYKTLSAFDVMEAYRKEYSRYPLEHYSFITIENVVYKIIQDDKYGVLTAPNGKRYRIETNIRN